MSTIKPKKGFDASRFQGLIDFVKAAKGGYEFVIAKATEGGLHGSNIVDPYFVKNFEGSTKAGIQFNAYHYFLGISENDAKDEADRHIRTLKSVKFDGYSFCDVEDKSLNKNPADLTRFVNSFFDHMESNGFKKLGIYCDLYFLTKRLIFKDLKPGILIWLADYNKSVPAGIKFDVWQDRSNSRVPGVNGYCDEDFSYTDLIGKPKPVVKKAPVKKPAPKPVRKPEPAKTQTVPKPEKTYTVEQVKKIIDDALSLL